MKKKTGKFLLILTILIFSISCLTNACEASWVISDPGLLDPGTQTLPPEANEMAGNLLGVLQVIGSIISVIILMVLGIRYMTGSVAEKAEYKKSMFPYLIGAVLVFTGTVLPKVIYDIVTKIQ